MTLKIRRAAVLGAGVMGAQIAAHLAAAGIRCHLLDLPSDTPPEDRKLKKVVGKNVANTRAILAIENLKKLKPAPLYSLSVLPNIIPGNFDDDMAVLADCDWVIEAVIERLDIKQNLHKRIAEYARPGVPITTNTSGISLAEIVDGLPEEYCKRFFGTHFFNPPRYMRLLEIIPHGAVDRDLVTNLSSWIEERLGKGIVVAQDTVNFIANRVGVFATQATLRHMDELDLNVETIDALTGPLIGRAKSATLRTMDVVGLDTFAAVARNTYDRDQKDPYRDWFKGPAWVENLIKTGRHGQKTKSVGCYKKTKDAKGKTQILAYRPKDDDYVEQQPQMFPWAAEAKKIKDTVERIKFIIGHDDPGAQLVWRAVRDPMSYASYLLEDIASGSPRAVDNAIKWGFNWEYGPFELWQALGYDEVLNRIRKDDAPLPTWVKEGLEFYKPAPGSEAWLLGGGPSEELVAPAAKHAPIPQPKYRIPLPKSAKINDPRVIKKNNSASLLDIGDGVACLSFHSKMNAIDNDIIALMQESVAIVDQQFAGLVVANDGEAFSAGANLMMVLGAIQQKKWSDIDQLLRQFQGAVQLMKYAPFPSVTCPQGLTLGGGCEIAMHGSHRVVAGDTFAGLVEMGVGLIPAGGGTKELALRSYDMMSLAERGDPMPFLQHAFMLIGMAQVSQSGLDAIEKGLFPAATSSLSISRDHQVERAKVQVLQSFKAGYRPPIPQTAVPVAGDPGINTFRLMLYNMVEGRQISEYDAFIGERIATVLCGGEVDGGTRVSEQYFLDLERRVFVELCQQEKTAARIEHMLKTGKPLRN